MRSSVNWPWSAAQILVGDIGLSCLSDDSLSCGPPQVLAAVSRSALSRRVRPLGIKRGVLELEVVDERWVEPLLELIPRLAGRLAARHPQLGVRRLKIRCADRDFAREPVLEAETASASESETGRADSRAEPSVSSIEAIRDRYLERQRSR